MTNQEIIKIGIWEKMFGLLRIYKECEGHCNVPHKHKEDGKNLGVWLSSQRTRKKTGKLGISLIERLEDIGVIWDLCKEKWKNNYRLLVKFQQREGHANVPISHKEEGVNLGKWLDGQRRQKKKGELDISLEKHLEEVGVIWDLCKEKWKNSYRLLVKFQQREGHANVPFSHREEGMNLGHWLDWQRQQKRKGELVISLEKRLEEVGVIWNVFREQWGNNYLLLVKYQQREGHANVPKKHKEEGVNLGFWLQEQRSRKKKRELDISLKKRLEDIGFIWDVLQEQWENNYRLLVKFQQREEHANVPSKHREEGVNLGFWLQQQRKRKRKGELDISLEERLEEVGVIWNVFKEQWGDNYLLLVKYQQREGHANVPKKHEEEGLNLGSWLDAQRTRKKKRKLDISREKLLDNIGTGTVWI